VDVRTDLVTVVSVAANESSTTRRQRAVDSLRSRSGGGGGGGRVVGVCGEGRIPSINVAYATFMPRHGRGRGFNTTDFICVAASHYAGRVVPECLGWRVDFRRGWRTSW
jgi:hypothetical protein